jgi:hypothetical protein
MNRLVKFAFALLMLLSFQYGDAQDIAHSPRKKHLLKGKWQLVSTFTEGNTHSVAKEEYDGTITFLSFHRYIEEVNYESNHWIIKGKWKVFRHKATLLLTQRRYTLNELEKNPADITFELTRLDKEHWTGATTAKGAPVTVTYQLIPRKKK